MTNPQNTIADAARRGQEAVTSAMQIWADSVQKLVGSLPTPDTRVPSPDEIVDQVFGFAEQMLATQREFTKSVLSATAARSDEPSRTRVRTRTASSPRRRSD